MDGFVFEQISKNIHDKDHSFLRFDKKQKPIKFPEVVVHSANPIGSANIMGYINNFLMNEGQSQTCVRVQIEHTV